MSYIVKVPNGIMCLFESKVECPYCTRHMPLEEFEDTLWKSKNPIIKKKCKGCKRFIGIASTMNGDYIGITLQYSKHEKGRNQKNRNTLR